MHTNTRVENYTRVSCVDFAWKSAILHAIPVGQNLFRTDVTKTGNGERGAGNGERKSGNELSAETSIKIQNGR